jgi:hypothetical protein
MKDGLYVEGRLRGRWGFHEGRLGQRSFMKRRYFNIDLTNILRIDVELVVGHLD